MDGEQGERGGGREAGAREEGRGGAEAVPEQTGGDAGGQHGEAGGEVEQAEGGAAQRAPAPGRRSSRDSRPWLRPMWRPHRAMATKAAARPGTKARSRSAAASTARLARSSPRGPMRSDSDPGRIGGGRIDEVHHHQNRRGEPERKALGGRLEDQEGLAEPGQGEEQADPDHGPISARRAA